MAPQLTIGTRAQVFHGTAKHTTGNLTKSDLKRTVDGRIVSRKASAAARRNLKRNPEFRQYIALAKKNKGKKFKKMTKIGGPRRRAHKKRKSRR